MTKYSRVRAVVCLGHLDHGHTYTVWAKFRFGPDAVMLQRHLRTVTEQIDHTTVSDDLSLAENLAEHVGKQLPGCLFVEFRRDPEGFVGEWELPEFAVPSDNLAPHCAGGAARHG